MRPQKDIYSLDEKRENVKEAFAVTDTAAVAGRKIILLDDFFDSGATMAEAGRILLAAGAREVVLLAAARTSSGWRRD